MVLLAAGGSPPGSQAPADFPASPPGSQAPARASPGGHAPSHGAGPPGAIGCEGTVTGAVTRKGPVAQAVRLAAAKGLAAEAKGN